MNAKIVSANSIAHKMNRKNHTGAEIITALNSEEGFDDHHFIVAGSAIYMVHDDTEQRQFICNVLNK